MFVALLTFSLIIKKMQNNGGFEKSQFINTIVFAGFILAVILFFQYTKKDEREKLEQAKIEEVARAKKVEEKLIAINTGEKIQLKNEELTLEVSSLGGQLSSVRINQYNAYDKEDKNKPLYLLNNENSDYGFQFKDKSGKIINTKDLTFTPTLSENSITMQTQINEANIKFIYTLQPNYKVDFQVQTQGLSKITNDNKAGFTWDYQVLSLEKGKTQEQGYTEFVYSFDNFSDFDTDARSELDETSETLDWIGIKQQFFAAVLEAKNGFTQSTGNQEIVNKGDYLKRFNYNAEVHLSANKELNENFAWYFMPLQLDLLKSYDKNFDEILPLGWSFIRTINVWFFIPIYEFIASWGLTAGWAIFVLTIIVKIVLSPIMFKQHKLSAMMRVIRPEVDAVNEKYKDADPLKKQQEVMSVYRNAGVNQLAGCIPALLQLPIFYALFRFFPNYIDFRGQSFWFAEDLSSYDDVIQIPSNFLGIDHLSIFALACTVAILLYTVMTSSNIQTPQQEGMPNMKPFMYIFPITFMFFLNSAASGLSWYYFVSNALNIIIILVIKHLIIDENKIRAQIQENKAKPVKESRFQRKMRELMEQAQEAKREQERQNKKK
ncbi:MAG: membrane protein insertase YidC [Flavobacteriaceae bacterium]|nr:membrane protein insertase YidC [Flavobacteriaceae bacterium]